MILSKLLLLLCYYGYLNYGRNMVATEESSSSLKVQLMTSSTTAASSTATAVTAVSKKDSQVKLLESFHQ